MALSAATARESVAGICCTASVNAFASLAVPFVIVAVRVTVVVLAGLVTTPVALTMLGWLEVQLIVVPSGPVIGRVRFCETLDAESPLAKMICSEALATATAWASVVGACRTVSVNVFASLAPPFVIVAVRVTEVVLVGRVTTPAALTILALSEFQLIVVPLNPVDGRVRFCVTLVAESPLAYVICRAVVSAATLCASVSVPLLLPFPERLTMKVPVSGSSLFIVRFAT